TEPQYRTVRARRDHLDEIYPGVDGLSEKCCEVNLCGGVGIKALSWRSSPPSVKNCVGKPGSSSAKLHLFALSRPF
ncbi:MAG: hypothetical protein ACR2JE_13205, partial [Acidobacteriaceae bacterium]